MCWAFFFLQHIFLSTTPWTSTTATRGCPTCSSSSWWRPLTGPRGKSGVAILNWVTRQPKIYRFAQSFYCYLTTHSTHFILQLYGIGHVVKDHSDCENVNSLPPLHGLLVLISSKEYFICIIPQIRIVFVIPVVKYWLAR